MVAGQSPRGRVIVAPDKYRGTMTAQQAARAMARMATLRGWDPVQLPLSDGGEGFLDVLGGPNRLSTVTGPDGSVVDAAWGLHEGRAVIESARACGLALAGGRSRNNPLTATTTGVGELLVAALGEGAREVWVGLGGSATVDGGRGALEHLRETVGSWPDDVPLRVACDVATPFERAAAVFGPQKGAGPDDVRVLGDRLDHWADDLLARYGVEVRGVPRTGAAGGMAGGLLAVGADLASGFDLVAEALGLEALLRDAVLVITGEGHLDSTSLHGKVVGEVIHRAAAHDVPVLVVAGRVARPLEHARLGAPGQQVETLSMCGYCGAGRAFGDAVPCLEEATAEGLTRIVCGAS